MTPETARLLTKHAVARSPDRASLNRLISSSYARLYLGCRPLRWAGMACFVSNHVGCSIRSRVMGVCTRWFLGPGNRLVFEDVYPALMFYHDLIRQGERHDRIIDQLRDYGPAADKIVQALHLLGTGAASPEILERESAEIILYHEQSQILQEKVFLWKRVARSPSARRCSPGAGRRC